MKKIKILLLLLTVTIAGFYSCTDSNPVENEVVTTKSISLRTTLNEIKKANNIGNKNTVATQDVTFCFNFVYPITLAYNDGTVITVISYEGLIEVLTNETSALYIEGIEFPFQVQQGGAVITINNEDEFFALIQDCDDFHTVNSFVFDFTCYSIVYPISVINGNQETIVVNNQTELLQMVASTPTTPATYQLNIVFPISVIQNDQTIVIHDLYEFFDLNNDCASSGCVCTEEYAPVCVQTPAGIVEYSNACHAECDGYTTSDFVNCDGTTPCNCSPIFDPVCVQTSAGVVQFDNACRAECEGFTSADFIECGVAPLPTFGELLGTCFQIQYPVQVQTGGALVTVNNDGECLQYWFPAQSAYPAFNYPIVVTFTGVITTSVLNQSAFQTMIAQHCN